VGRDPAVVVKKPQSPKERSLKRGDVHLEGAQRVLGKGVGKKIERETGHATANQKVGRGDRTTTVHPEATGKVVARASGRQERRRQVETAEGLKKEDDVRPD